MSIISIDSREKKTNSCWHTCRRFIFW